MIVQATASHQIPECRGASRFKATSPFLHPWATKVKEEGWKGFGEHMELVSACFEKAWESAPHRIH